MKEDRPKIGLALGGGYARGLAHIGILEVMEREGIPIDFIAGTSMGALVGALYAREKEAAIVKHQAEGMNWVSMANLIDPAVSRSGLIAGKRVTSLLKRLMGDVTFDELAIPFACVATDIISGEEVVLKEGKVIEAVRASISVPVIFTAVKKNGRFLVDGGLVNNVPVNVVRSLGADYVIAVDVTPNRKERAEHLALNAEPREPSRLQVIIQSIYITTYLTDHAVTAGADMVIHPKLAQINPTDFHKTRECALEGELAAEDMVPKIKRDLAALRNGKKIRSNSLKCETQKE